MHSNHITLTPNFTKSNHPVTAMGKPKRTYNRLFSKLSGSLKSALGAKAKPAPVFEIVGSVSDATSMPDSSPSDDDYISAPYKFTDFFPPKQNPYAAYPPKILNEYYGRELVATMSARFITSRFTINNTDLHTEASCGERALPHFIAHALHYINLPDSINMCALILLQRFNQRFPKFRVKSYQGLYLTALMVAAKMSWDRYYSISCWSNAGQGIFAPQEMIIMEREFCWSLQWSFNVCQEDMDELEDTIIDMYRADGVDTTFFFITDSWSPVFVDKNQITYVIGDSIYSPMGSSKYPVFEIVRKCEFEDNTEESSPSTVPSAASHSTSSLSSSGSPK
ncbi:hypothetical protein CTheo_6718 [Ceratobasidium theobromae]|uniref:Cyclin N-terminal domain-containing protein n=1 Tax=Ceratobasidium theobromae TaxID=1582974 RepID=A0A5N5QEG0_9AGAM|nr:hypothetical protein CTheo_6718 [Ceratobasidium theobromae]